jgi:hypothetical protein
MGENYARQKQSPAESDSRPGYVLVGDTGLEPMTSSV